MAIIYQPSLFPWKTCRELGDLERLKMVLEVLPDESLMSSIEERRKRGRNDYPVRAVWNSLIAGIIYQHPTLASLSRELSRNAQLREMCGFDPLKGALAVPSKDAYSRFLIILKKFPQELDRIFSRLVELVGEFLPDFGEHISIDSEALTTFARGRGKPNSKRDLRAQESDQRRDNEADWGKKFIMSNESGEPKRVSKTWFGYKLHLLVDASHELPITYHITRASTHDGPRAFKLMAVFAETHPLLFSRCKYVMADRAYDNAGFTTELWQRHGIKTVIDTRKLWRGDTERLLEKRPGLNSVTCNEGGEIFCSCPITDEVRVMPLGGFERDRDTIKFRCPATHYGIECRGRSRCPVAKGLRVPLAENRRIFTPVPRNSLNWTKLYKKRTSVERVFSRLDTSYGFDVPKMRGKVKFILKSVLSLSVMLALAVARLKRNQITAIRSLIQTA